MNSTEQKIIEAAHYLFFHFGFKKTSVDEIAARAGVGKGTIYNYFSDKEELFKKLALTTSQAVKSHVEQEIAPFTQADERVFQRFAREFKFFQSQRASFGTTKALMEEMFEVCNKMEALMDTKREGLHQDLALGVKQGLFKEMNVEETGQTLVTIWSQFIIKWLYMDEEEMQKEQTAVLTLMIDGIRA